MLTSVVRIAIATLLTDNGIAPPLSATTHGAPTITFTADQPRVAATLKRAMMMATIQPNEKREIVIWRSPSLGPSVEKKATGRTPRALKMMITAKPSQKPRPRNEANVPRASVEMTRLAASHMVKSSGMRTWVRVVGETRSIPCVSMPLSSGMLTVSEAIRQSSLFEAPSSQKSRIQQAKPPTFLMRTGNSHLPVEPHLTGDACPSKRLQPSQPSHFTTHTLGSTRHNILLPTQINGTYKLYLMHDLECSIVRTNQDLRPSG